MKALPSRCRKYLIWCLNIPKLTSSVSLQLRSNTPNSSKPRVFNRAGFPHPNAPHSSTPQQ
jgi:hypothetical protein